MSRTMTASAGCPSPCVAVDRRKTFIDAGREAFFAHGYAGATMSSIAATVGGSKTTLWTYFPSKEELFTAVVEDLLKQYGMPLSKDFPLDEPVADVLARYAETLMSMLMSQPMLDLYRLVVGEAARFPHLAQTFYELGPKRGKERLGVYFAALMERKVLRRGLPATAVSQFIGLCQPARYQLAILGLEAREAPLPPREELAAAIETFLHYWGAPGAKPAGPCPSSASRGE